MVIQVPRNRSRSDISFKLFLIQIYLSVEHALFSQIASGLFLESDTLLSDNLISDTEFHQDLRTKFVQ